MIALTMNSERFAGSLCKWHNGATFKLKKITDISKKKKKFLLNYNSCNFPVYVHTDSKQIHLKDMYNRVCIKHNTSRYSAHDMQNSCLANVQHNDTYCYGIKNQDMQSSCLATVKHNDTYCYGIRNLDMQNNCLANVQHSDTYCYGIKN